MRSSFCSELGTPLYIYIYIFLISNDLPEYNELRNWFEMYRYPHTSLNVIHLRIRIYCAMKWHCSALLLYMHDTERTVLPKISAVQSISKLYFRIYTKDGSV